MGRVCSWEVRWRRNVQRCSHWGVGAEAEDSLVDVADIHQCFCEGGYFAACIQTWAQGVVSAHHLEYVEVAALDLGGGPVLARAECRPVPPSTTLCESWQSGQDHAQAIFFSRSHHCQSRTWRPSVAISKHHVWKCRCRRGSPHWVRSAVAVVAGLRCASTAKVSRRNVRSLVANWSAADRPTARTKGVQLGLPVISGRD